MINNDRSIWKNTSGSHVLPHCQALDNMQFQSALQSAADSLKSNDVEDKLALLLQQQHCGCACITVLWNRLCVLAALLFTPCVCQSEQTNVPRWMMLMSLQTIQPHISVPPG